MAVIKPFGALKICIKNMVFQYWLKSVEIQDSGTNEKF